MSHVTRSDNPSTPPRSAEPVSDRLASSVSSSARIATPLFDPYGLSAPFEAAVEQSLPHDVTTAQSPDSLQQVTGGSIDNDSPSSSVKRNIALDDVLPVRRGRRRRSSEKVTDHQAVPLAPSHLSRLSTQSESASLPTGPTTRLWWQRGSDDNGATDQEGARQDVHASVGQADAKDAGQRPAKIAVNTSFGGTGGRTRQASEGANASSSQSPSVRSPAAAFLSSMNESLASPTNTTMSNTWSTSQFRGNSMSPIRQDPMAHQQFASLPDSGSASFLARSQSIESRKAGHFGIGSAAAHLYDSQPSSSGMNAGQYNQGLRPDDEGARFGPSGRYLLGKKIGVGGFSTIREAWDLGEDADQEDIASVDRERWHHVAVKIVYRQDGTTKGDEKSHEKGVGDAMEEDELDVWQSIPAHPNLLPLLYHERLHIQDQSASGKQEKHTIDFIVMPFCECNLLSFVKSSGVLAANSETSARAAGTDAGAALVRSASTRSNMEPKEPTSTSNVHAPGRRTGSGFIPHAHRATIVADRIVSNPPYSSLMSRTASSGGAASSNDASASSGLPSSILRHASLRKRAAAEPASRGIPIGLARTIMRQLAEAMICLHLKAGVLHGDLKLENVLGQPWTTQPPHPSGTAEDQGHLEAHSAHSKHDNGQPVSAEASNICWRVADFGLSRRVRGRLTEDVERVNHPPVSVSRNPLNAIDGQSVGNFNSSRSQSIGASSFTQARLAGGSLAYTAPEVFHVAEPDEADGASQFAPDMWALGCILYAMLAGKLPFTDSFEPRLQNKIAQGRWEMPDRLKRRGFAGSGGGLDSLSNSIQMDRASAASTVDAAGNLEGLRRASIHHNHAAKPSISGALPSSVPVDMSASMPSLPPRYVPGMTRTIPHSLSNNSVFIADDSTSYEASVMADEEDLASDAEDQADKAMDGLSKDRVAVRRVLRGLLEPVAARRWTVQQLAANDWISGQEESFSSAFSGQHELGTASGVDGHGDEQRAAGAFDPDKGLPASLVSALQQGLGASTEHSSLEDGGLYERDELAEMVPRGRAPRRQERGGTSPTRAKPIDIDRSSSRSRSRARDDSPMWEPDGPVDVRHHRRQELDALRQDVGRSSSRGGPSSTRSDSRSVLGSGVRSSSMDVHSTRSRFSQIASPTNDSRDSSRSSRHPGTQDHSSDSRSRSQSRNRRSELDLIMPQLSLRHSNTATDAVTGRLIEGDFDIDQSSPATSALPLHHDEHSAQRSSTWRSPTRARDRLAGLVGGSREGSRSPTQSFRGTEQERNPDPREEGRSWWSRGRGSKKDATS